MTMDTTNNIEEQPLETTASDMPSTCQLNLSLIDVMGNPIKTLDYRIEIDGKPYFGTTDDQGHAQEFGDLPFGAIAQVYVKRLDGTYKFIGETPLNSVETNICAVSPKVLIEVETFPHEGESGNADVDIGEIEDKVKETKQDATKAAKDAHIAMAEAVKSTAESPQKADQVDPKNNSAKGSTTPPALKAKTTGGQSPKTDTKVMRDKDGQPHAVVKEVPKNWFDKHFPGAFYIWRLADFLKPAPVPSKVVPKANEALRKSETKIIKDNNDKLKKKMGAKKALTKSNTETSTAVHVPTVAPRTNAAIPVPVSAENLEQLKRLLEFADTQAGWNYPVKSTAGIAALFTKAIDKEYIESATKVKKNFAGYCYPYVKIALWHCGITSGLLGGERPGFDAGDELIRFGFKDVTDELPDARWAAPGDVITYQWTDETWEQRKKKKKNDSYPNYGHIDIRTYDGYISDAVSDHFPAGGGRNPMPMYKNIRIYRKVYDPLAVLRMKAFLSALVEIETKGIPDDKKFYRLNTHLPNRESMYFDSFKQHPWAGLPKPTGKNESTASGAYQIVVGTAEANFKALGLPDDTKEKFTPEIQSRLAVVSMESPTRKGALGAIRSGDLDTAISTLRGEWSSLPAASESHISDAGFKSLYNGFLDNEKMKAGIK